MVSRSMHDREKGRLDACLSLSREREPEYRWRLGTRTKSQKGAGQKPEKGKGTSEDRGERARKARKKQGAYV